LDQLPQIIEAFEHLIARDSQIVNAEVVSAVALESAQQERIASELQQQYGVDSDYLHFKVDETLIGGLIIRIGDKVFDNSLRARLGSVQRSMMMS
jgi:F-type H+-transporting ATPase subunit delta